MTERVEKFIAQVKTLQAEYETYTPEEKKVVDEFMFGKKEEK